VKTVDVLSMFQKSLGAVSNQTNIDERFQLHLHVTETPKVDEEESDKLEMKEERNASLPFVRGRPNFDLLFEKISEEAAVFPNSSVGCFLCGPGPMVDQVTKLNLWHNFEFHIETFEL